MLAFNATAGCHLPTANVWGLFHAQIMFLHHNKHGNITPVSGSCPSVDRRVATATVFHQMGVAAGGKLLASAPAPRPTTGAWDWPGKNVPCVALFTYSVKLYYWMYGIETME